jgi:hypothetical protein
MIITHRMDYFTGLDLGQSRDFTALAVLERSNPAVRCAATHYAVRHLERLALGTPYTEVCTRVAALFATPPLANSKLIVDQSAVGKPVLDLLRQAKMRAKINSITITAGHKSSWDDGGWLVPKKDLVGTLQVLLQAQRIKVAPTLPEAQMLVQELTNFKAKVPTAASDMLGDWREGQHDDLVLAVAIAAWAGERSPPASMIRPYVFEFRGGGSWTR